MDRETWWATVHGVTKELDMTQRLEQNKELLETSRAFTIFGRIIFMRSLELIWLRAVICGMPSWRTRTAFSFRVGVDTTKLKSQKKSRGPFFLLEGWLRSEALWEKDLSIRTSVFILSLFKSFFIFIYLWMLCAGTWDLTSWNRVGTCTPCSRMHSL